MATPSRPPEQRDDREARDVHGAASSAKDVRSERPNARRQHTLHRGMLTTAVAGLLFVAGRGSLALAFPPSRPAPALALALAVASVLFVMLLVAGLRIRTRMGRGGSEMRHLELERGDRISSDRGSPIRTRAEHGNEAAPVDESRGSRFVRTAVALIVVAVAVGAAATMLDTERSSARRWTFADASDPAALGFRTEALRAGGWTVERDSTATAAHSLSNRIGDADSPPATLVANDMRARDVRAVTRCKATGSDKAGCGIVFRFRDDRHHHLARVDVAERRLVLAIVDGGVERELAASPARVDADIWQELVVEVRGDRLRAICNGRDVVETEHHVPGYPGTVGLWVPATGAASFDELAVDVLPASAQSLEILPLIGAKSG